MCWFLAICFTSFCVLDRAQSTSLPHSPQAYRTFHKLVRFSRFGSHGSVRTVRFHDSMPRLNAPFSMEQFGSHGLVHTGRSEIEIANRKSCEFQIYCFLACFLCRIGQHNNDPPRTDTTHDDPPISVTTRYDPLRPDTTCYDPLRYCPLRPAMTRNDPPRPAERACLCV